VAACLVRWMQALGYDDAQVDAVGNAVGVRGSGPRELLLLGHIDTVPGVIPVRVADGELHGRGAVDAKGPFAAFVVGVARAALAVGVTVRVVGAVEEECATSAGARHVARSYASPEAIIIGEPSSWDRLTLGYKGRLLVDYCLTQPMAHRAGQQETACEAAVAYWQQVVAYAAAFNADQERQFDRLDPSLRQIVSSDDGLFETVTMSIGLRLPPGLDVAALQAQVQAWAGAATVTTRGLELAVSAGRRNPLTSSFLAAIRAAGAKGAFVVKTGTSDMNVLARHFDCPIAAYGPGDSALDHTPEERINLDEYLRACRVVQGVVERLGR
jgi:LysW-gamma-L-lysine carboxypeptidase